MAKLITRAAMKTKTSNDILDSAIRVFSEKGYSGTTLFDIGKAAGVSQGLVSQRFESKKNLFLEIIKVKVSKIIDAFPFNMTIMSFLANIIETTKIKDKTIQNEQAFWHMLYTSKDIPENIFEEFRRMLEDSPVLPKFKEAMESGILKEDDPFASFVKFMKTTMELSACYMENGLPFPPNSVYLAVIVNSKYLDAEISREKEKFNIISSINKNYEYIASVNIETRDVIPYHIGPLAQGLMNTKQFEPVPIATYMKFLLSVIIPEDKDYFVEMNHFTSIFAGLNAAPMYSFNFRVKIGSEIRYFQIKYIRDEFDPKNVIVGVLNVDTETKLEIKNNILEKELIAKQEIESLYEKLKESSDFNNLFVRKYISMYYINLDDHSFVVWTREERITGKYGFIYDYLESALKYVNEDVHPDDRERLAEALQPDYIKNRLKEEDDFSLTYRDISTGEERYYKYSVIKGNDDSHCAFGFKDVDEIIRERQRLDEENRKKLAEETDMFIHLARKYTSLYYLNPTTKDYRVFLLSEKVKDMTVQLINQYNRSFEELSIAFVEKYVHPDDRMNMIDALANYKEKFQHQRSFKTLFRRNYNDEYRYTEIECVKVDRDDDNDFDGIIVGFMDVDEEHKLELENKKQLEDAKMAAEAASLAKTTFLFNMSHDIRTPMNAIIGFTQMAERNISNKEVVKDCLTKVQSSNMYLLRLINDVLDMARIESGKMTIEESPVNIQTRENEFIEIFRSNAAEKNIELIANFDSITSPLVYQDALRTRQIVANVISNAIKYTKPDGKIWYTIRQLPCLKEGYASFLYTIKDTGIGMSEEFLEHVFEQFSRAKSTTISGIQGTGLGMAIVKKLVEMMGGKIRVESELGVGTTVSFWIDFRLADQAAYDEENQEIDFAGEQSLKNLKILLVEDNELNREIAIDILKEAGADVDFAEDGSIAVEKVSHANPTDYDIILMDIQMPYMDGYEATKLIRKLKSDISKIPIIAMTANAFEEDRRRALDSGMDGHIAKPIDIPVLIATIKKFRKII